MLTPIRNPRNRAEERYNSRHKRARSVIEQSFGLLKLRFLCLHKFGGCLVYSPERCLRIITSCFILHNICIDYNIQIDEDLVPEEAEEEDLNEQQMAPVREDVRRAGVQVRNTLIAERFS